HCSGGAWKGHPTAKAVARIPAPGMINTLACDSPDDRALKLREIMPDLVILELRANEDGVAPPLGMTILTHRGTCTCGSTSTTMSA
ncbi:hypothetical protein N9F34_03285, partial [Alphaproteobacteria bacterium]|nr:hypothetical protein [Alphaproteobacteria bacterium]